MLIFYISKQKDQPVVSDIFLLATLLLTYLCKNLTKSHIRPVLMQRNGYSPTSQKTETALKIA
jgi:hypothetical protein